MKKSIQIATLVIALVVPSHAVVQDVVVEEKIVYVTRTGDAPIHTPAAMPSALLAESAQGQTLSVATVPASAITPVNTLSPTIFTPSTTIPVTSADGGAVVSPVAPLGDGVMKIVIANHWTEPLSISYGDNAGSPGALGAPTSAPLGTATTVVYPTGWAGRIYIGKTINSADSKIEGSTTGANDIDVSYVDGYSVPITCSNADTPVTGCNIDLFAAGTCKDMVGEKDVCLNPMQGVADGPADTFFLPCQGAAYTFPNDNVANDGDTRGAEVKCCIGTEAMGCKAPDRQGKGNDKASKAKRSPYSESEQAFAPKEAAEEDTNADLPVVEPHTAAHAHSYLARHLKRAKARHQNHGLARGLKDMV